MEYRSLSLKTMIHFQPNVTIIIAAYNAEATIARAIGSALAEPEVAEVIVIDDFSVDQTVSAASAANDGSGRLRVLRQPSNQGPSAARNRAIAESLSDWIGILDADDFFVPGRVACLLRFSEQADMIADDMWQVAEHAVDGPRLALLGDTLAGPLQIGFDDFVLSNVTRRGRARRELGFIKPLMRREFLAAHRLHYQDHMRLGEDFELYARALALGARLWLVPQQGYVSVVRPDSLSGQHSETDLLHLRDCDNALRRELPLTAKNRKALWQHYISVDCRLQWRRLISAVKKRQVRAALTTFIRPYPVGFYLVRQLWTHLITSR